MLFSERLNVSRIYDYVALSQLITLLKAQCKGRFERIEKSIDQSIFENAKNAQFFDVKKQKLVRFFRLPSTICIFL